MSAFIIITIVVVGMFIAPTFINWVLDSAENPAPKFVRTKATFVAIGYRLGMFRGE